MVHPITGETISSYKKLMHDPATAEIWQTAFGKDFGGMAQGGNKTGQKGTNAMFVMTHDEIEHVLRDSKKFTYGNRSASHPDHGGWKFNHLCVQPVRPNRGFRHRQAPLEQHDQHCGRTVHVPRHKEFLPHG
jgi:hypothetical protein